MDAFRNIRRKTDSVRAFHRNLCHDGLHGARGGDADLNKVVGVSVSEAVFIVLKKNGEAGMIDEGLF